MVDARGVLLLAFKDKYFNGQNSSIVQTQETFVFLSEFHNLPLNEKKNLSGSRDESRISQTEGDNLQAGNASRLFAQFFSKIVPGGERLSLTPPWIRQWIEPQG